jgi:hypothetical protein
MSWTHSAPKDLKLERFASDFDLYFPFVLVQGWEIKIICWLVFKYLTIFSQFPNVIAGIFSAIEDFINALKFANMPCTETHT